MFRDKLPFKTPDVTKRYVPILVALVTLLSGGYFVFTLATATGAFNTIPRNDASSYPAVVVGQEGMISATNGTNEAATATESFSAVTELPVRLIIPGLAINAPVQKVGLTAEGAMGVPSNFTDVAWYQHGTIPGNRGSAVMAGHLDNGLRLAGVFKNLHQLAPGNEITVATASGTRLSFYVDEVTEYGYREVPLEKVFNRSDAAWLVLITCAGNWLPQERTYDKRLVVYARLSQN